MPSILALGKARRGVGSPSPHSAAPISAAISAKRVTQAGAKSDATLRAAPPYFLDILLTVLRGEPPKIEACSNPGTDSRWFCCPNNRTEPLGIAREGIGFTDYYGQQSCTAGRAAFINGSVPVRSGMTKVGKPFFCWWNGTRMHFRTHVKAEHL